jgi:hypothetical protein
MLWEVERPHLIFVILMKKSKFTLLCPDGSMFAALDLITLERS